MTANTIRVLAVDDSETFLRGVESIISVEEDMTLVGKATTGEKAMRLMAVIHPDVSLIDLRLRWREEADRPSQAHGIKTIREIIRRFPRARIIVISSFSERRWVVQAIKAGAHGYLPKEASAAQIVQAIRTVAAGDVVLTAEQLTWLREPAERLTQREKEVLALLVQGRSDIEIARALGIATRTASKHVENIREKLGVKNRWEAVVEARRRGLY